jgi:hypothetical protein
MSMWFHPICQAQLPYSSALAALATAVLAVLAIAALAALAIAVLAALALAALALASQALAALVPAGGVCVQPIRLCGLCQLTQWAACKSRVWQTPLRGLSCSRCF